MANQIDLENDTPWVEKITSDKNEAAILYKNLTRCVGIKTVKFSINSFGESPTENM